MHLISKHRHACHAYQKKKKKQLKSTPWHNTAVRWVCVERVAVRRSASSGCIEKSCSLDRQTNWP